MLGTLLGSIAQYCRGDLELLITENVPETLSRLDDFPFPIHLIRNTTPCGFGENQNTAFRHSRGEFFCVMNPDIHLTSDPFPELIALLERHPRAGVVAPLVTTPSGELEDSARDFPTPWSIAKKFFGHNRDREFLRGALNADAIPVDWVAGMFMLVSKRCIRRPGRLRQSLFSLL